MDCCSVDLIIPINASVVIYCVLSSLMPILFLFCAYQPERLLSYSYSRPVLFPTRCTSLHDKILNPNSINRFFMQICLLSRLYCREVGKTVAFFQIHIWCWMNGICSKSAKMLNLLDAGDSSVVGHCRNKRLASVSTNWPRSFPSVVLPVGAPSLLASQPKDLWGGCALIERTWDVSPSLQSIFHLKRSF